ncbi:MAG TPA: sialidase family protein, partial [Candidatus Kapabacteria bacterium]|nr:sialidase family protein [Candidatus Kapabacteria bacterium]
MTAASFFITNACVAQWEQLTIDSKIPSIWAISGDTIIAGIGDTTYSKILMSIDGGETWIERLYSTNDSGVSVEAIDPGNIAIWYVHIKGNDSITLWETTDAGETWLPKDDPSKTGVGFISWSNPNVLYTIAIGQNVQTRYHIFFERSSDGGTIWDTIEDVSSDPITQNEPSLSIAQDLADSNVLYMFEEYSFLYGGEYEWTVQDFYVSYDGGQSWGHLLQPGKGDFGGLYADPGAAGDLYFRDNEPLTSQLWH